MPRINDDEINKKIIELKKLIFKLAEENANDNVAQMLMNILSISISVAKGILSIDESLMNTMESFKPKAEAG